MTRTRAVYLRYVHSVPAFVSAKDLLLETIYWLLLTDDLFKKRPRALCDSRRVKKQETSLHSFYLVERFKCVPVTQNNLGRRAHCHFFFFTCCQWSLTCLIPCKAPYIYKKIKINKNKCVDVYIYISWTSRVLKRNERAELISESGSSPWLRLLSIQATEKQQLYSSRVTSQRARFQYLMFLLALFELNLKLGQAEEKMLFFSHLRKVLRERHFGSYDSCVGFITGFVFVLYLQRLDEGKVQ